MREVRAADHGTVREWRDVQRCSVQHLLSQCKLGRLHTKVTLHQITLQIHWFQRNGPQPFLLNDPCCPTQYSNIQYSCTFFNKINIYWEWNRKWSVWAVLHGSFLLVKFRGPRTLLELPHLLFLFSKINRIYEGLNKLENSWNFAHTPEVAKSFIWYGF